MQSSCVSLLCCAHRLPCCEPPSSAAVTPAVCAKDVDVNVLSMHCPRLSDLDLSGCVRMTGWGLSTLASSASLWEGRLSRLRLADTLPLRGGSVPQLLGRAVRAARCAPLAGLGVPEEAFLLRLADAPPLLMGGMRTKLDRA